MKFRQKFFWKWSFFDQNQQPKECRACWKNSSGIVHITMPVQNLFFSQSEKCVWQVPTVYTWFPTVFILFSRICKFFVSGLTPKFAKLSKILWKIWKFSKRISVAQVHSGVCCFESRVFIENWKWVAKGCGSYLIHPGNPSEFPSLLPIG